MLHLVLYGLLAVILAAGLFLVASRFLPAGEQIAPPLRDEPPWSLPPERSLHPEDVDSVRLPVALRGYRFAETDILLDRLATELRARDAEISRLRGRVPGATPGAITSGEPVGVAAPPLDAGTPTGWAPPWTDSARAAPPPVASVPSAEPSELSAEPSETSETSEPSAESETPEAAGEPDRSRQPDDTESQTPPTVNSDLEQTGGDDRS